MGLQPLSPVIDKKNVGPVEGGRIWPVHGDTLYIGTKPALEHTTQQRVLNWSFLPRGLFVRSEPENGIFK